MLTLDKPTLDFSLAEYYEEKFFLGDQFASDLFYKKYAGDFTNVYDFAMHMSYKAALGDPVLQDKFFSMFINRKFIPGGRILAAMGRPDSKVSYMNCTTYKIEEDSLEGIQGAIKAIMSASPRGQGIGIDLSALRPKDSKVNNSAQTSTGAISFMEVLDKVGGTIGQEGRRAAMLFTLAVDHPDLWREDGYDFINIKRQLDRVNNANISVLISDAFMQAVDQDRLFAMRFSVDSSGGKEDIVRMYPARQLMRKIAESAHTSAEPGLLFWDTSKRMSNSDLVGFPIAGLNACTEQVLDQQGVCNLGSLNLLSYVYAPFTEYATFDYITFMEDVQYAVEFLDNVNTLEIEEGRSISPTQAHAVKSLRRIGLGVMGYADALAALGLPYAMTKSTMEFTASVFSTLRDVAYSRSVALAMEKGVAPAIENATSEVLADGFFGTLPDHLIEQINQHGIRNITLLSIAPTGTISNIAQVSSGIEPVFAMRYIRKTRALTGEYQDVEYVHPPMHLAISANKDETAWTTAYEVDPLTHVRIQAEIQKYVDQSISKTVNLPGDATVEDVEQVYMEAWRLGLKGVTVYRDGSRDGILRVAEEEREDACPGCGEIGSIEYKEGCQTCTNCGWGLCG